MDDIRQRDLFRKFVSEMNVMLKSDEFAEELRGRDQENLLDCLFEAEEKFRKALLSSERGRSLYLEFMEFIVKEKKNILSARSYFRERQTTFSGKITEAFREPKPEILHSFRINYKFAKWIIERVNTQVHLYRRMRGQFAKMIRLREAICSQSLPLAINRAKIFWSKSGASLSVEYMDLIQASAEGLMSAIDKFVPPYRTVFRSVAIGRMTLNMSADNSATAVKLSPHERRILYRANNAKNKAKLTEDSDILGYVQESFKEVTSGNLSQIMIAASQVVSIDSTMESGTHLEDKMGDGRDYEEEIEKRDSLNKLYDTLSSLPMTERKVILLKLGEFENLPFILAKKRGENDEGNQ